MAMATPRAWKVLNTPEGTADSMHFLRNTSICLNYYHLADMLECI